jgi:hypothetical protein
MMAARRSVAGSGPQHDPHPGPAAEPPARSLRQARTARNGFLAGALLTVVVAALLLWLPHRSGGGAAATGGAVPASWSRVAVTADGLAERSGVKITQVAVTGGGGLVDLRYQVVDPDKAAALHDRRTPPALVDERTGLVVNQLFMDHSHHGAQQAGVKYYLVFNNPGNWVHRGSRVTVLLGDAEVQHVVVR